MSSKTSYEIMKDLYAEYGRHEFSLCRATVDDELMTEDEADLLIKAGLLIETTEHHEREVYSVKNFAFAMKHNLVNLSNCEWDAKHGYFVEHLEKMLCPWYALNPVFVEQVLEVCEW